MNVLQNKKVSTLHHVIPESFAIPPQSQFSNTLLLPYADNTADHLSLANASLIMTPVLKWKQHFVAGLQLGHTKLLELERTLFKFLNSSKGKDIDDDTYLMLK
eukprot:1754769-Ditylum_brightwellii.AAC.1